MSSTNAGESSGSAQGDYILYVGTYSRGVYAFRYRAAQDVKLEPLGLVGKVENPSFVTTDREFRFLYAVSELMGDAEGGAASFAINRSTGTLQPLNSRPSAGVAPCHLSVTPSGKAVIVANYMTGGVASFPVESDGRLGELASLMKAHGSSVNKERQDGPHAHEAVITADGQRVYVPDLGLDEIRIYRIEAGARLEPNEPAFVKGAAGQGPRHMVFSADEKYAYVVHELKAVVTVYRHRKEDGSLHEIQSIATSSEDTLGQCQPAEILIDRAGRFVYASNRGTGTIAVFRRDAAKGTLERIQVAATGGTAPRGVEFDPTGRYLFVGDQKANDFVLFAIDAASGELKLTGQKINVPSPVAFQFVPAK